MRYLSICSGIESATVAWHPLGWVPVAFAEIEPFPCAVLKHHYPHVPNWGDITRFKEWPDAVINVLVGGPPCQSYSVAGLRRGLADPRGNLTLTYLAIVDRYRPEWIVFENVPGILSSLSHDAPDPCAPPPPMDLGRDGAEVESEDEYDSEELHAFNSFLAGLSELGYGWATRVLDAQYVRIHGLGRAVPQRRRRVLVAGHLGDWRRAAAVFFEPESMSGNPPPRREAGERPAPTLAARTGAGGGLGTDFDLDGGQTAVCFGGNNTSGTIDVSTAMNGHAVPHGRMDFESETFAMQRVDHALRATWDGSEDGSGRGTPIIPVGVALRGRDEGGTAELTGEVCSALRAAQGGGDKPHVLEPIAFSCKDYGNDAQVGDTPTCRAMTHDGSHANAGGQLAIAFAENSRAELRLEGSDGRTVAALKTGGGKPGQSYPAIAFNARQDPVSGPVSQPLDTNGSSIGNADAAWRVRRLMPVECERLQGLPDGYTAIPYRGKPAADGPRYKAIGNAMAVNCMRWIGTRIQMVSDLAREMGL